MVWVNKSLLCKSSSQVFIREHFNEKVERNIRKLLPIRHAAIDQGKKVCLVEDKLTIDSKPNTVDNLHELPPDLSPDKLATKTINKHTFFFLAATPISNFHPSKFQIDKIYYFHGEKYVQATKARMFGDDASLTKIMSSNSLGEMKALGSKINNFNAVISTQSAPMIANALVDYLLATGENKLIDNDSLWCIGVSMYDPMIMTKQSQWGKNIQGHSLMNVRNSIRNASGSLSTSN